MHTFNITNNCLYYLIGQLIKLFHECMFCQMFPCAQGNRIFYFTENPINRKKQETCAGRTKHFIPLYLNKIKHNKCEARRRFILNILQYYVPDVYNEELLCSSVKTHDFIVMTILKRRTL